MTVLCIKVSTRRRRGLDHGGADPQCECRVKASLVSSSYSPGHPGSQLCTLQALLALSPVSPVRAPSVHAPQCVPPARPGAPLSGPHAGAVPIPWASRPLPHWGASAALPRHSRPSGPLAPVRAGRAPLSAHVALRRARRLINHHPGTRRRHVTLAPVRRRHVCLQRCARRPPRNR